MMDNKESPVDHRHVDESVLYSYVRSELPSDLAARIEEHLEHCLACRVWATRLQHASISDPGEQIISRLVDSSPAIPAALHDALTAAEEASSSPDVGELWRVGRDEAALVWVRRVLDDSAVVVPVVFDENLADNFSLIVPLEESPIDLELVLLTSVEGHVDFRAFLQPIGSLPVHDNVESLRQARKAQLPVPSNLIVGPPLVNEDDQRIEYRQVIADLLADLSPAAFSEQSDSELSDEGLDTHRFVEDLNELTWRRAGVRIRLLGELESFAVDPAHELLLIAVVEDLDASVLVSVLSGANPAQTLVDPMVASACGIVLREHPEAENVAVATTDVDWTTVVVDSAFAARAVEAPSGRFFEPRVPFQPLPLVDALLKHLDAYATRWDHEEPVEFDREPVDVTEMGAAFAKQSVERLIASGRRSASPKKEVYVAFGDSEIVQVADLLTAVATRGVEPSQAIDRLLEGQSE